MKNIYVFIMVLLIIGCSGKTNLKADKIERSLEGFQNVKWGETGENTTKLLNENGYELFAAYSNKEDRLFIGKVSDYNAAILCLFYHDKLYEVRVIIRDKTTSADSKKFGDTLTEKYGKPEEPLYKGDDMLRWEFDNNCMIRLYDFSDMDLTITYTNSSLEPPKEEKEVKQNDL